MPARSMRRVLPLTARYRRLISAVVSSIGVLFARQRKRHGAPPCVRGAGEPSIVHAGREPKSDSQVIMPRYNQCLPKRLASCMSRWLPVFCVLFSSPTLAQQRITDPVQVNAQAAGIDGREWDRTYPGALTPDAVHRSVLLRFPGAAELVRNRLERGAVIV